MEFNYFDIMMRAQKAYARVMDPICKQWELTRNEVDVLLFLANNPEYDRASDIVVNRGIAKSHVSLSVTTLEGRGLLQRQPDPEDRRTVHLKLVGEAWKIAEAGQAAQRDFFSRIHQGLSQEELHHWRVFAQKVSENIKNMEEV